MRVRNIDARYPIFSNFAVRSASGLTYNVEVRSVSQRRFSCNCVDFRINALGTCKHVEAVLLYLEARHARLFKQARLDGTPRIDVVVDVTAETLRVENADGGLPHPFRGIIDRDGRIVGQDIEDLVERLGRADIPGLRISQDVTVWLEARRRLEERKIAQREYERKVRSGEWPPFETLVPLYP